MEDSNCSTNKLKQIARILQYSCDNFDNLDAQIELDFQHPVKGNYFETINSSYLSRKTVQKLKNKF